MNKYIDFIRYDNQTNEQSKYLTHNGNSLSINRLFSAHGW